MSQVKPSYAISSSENGKFVLRLFLLQQFYILRSLVPIFVNKQRNSSNNIVGSNVIESGSLENRHNQRNVATCKSNRTHYN